MPKLQLTNNLKIQSLEKEKEREREKNLTQRMKDIPQIINNNNNLSNYNDNYQFEKDPIIKNRVYENENLNKNKIKIINKRLEIKKKNILLRNQYNQMLNIYNKNFINTSQINTAKSRGLIIDSGFYSPSNIKINPIIDNGLYSPSNIKINDISNNQTPNNISTKNNKSINYNFLITPYIANKTINIYSNNASQINSSSSTQKIKPQNQIKKIIISKHNSSNNTNKIAPKNNFPFNRNENNMNFELNKYRNSALKNAKPILGNASSYFEQNICYKRKYW
jgi:hypothetical protein